MELTDIETYDDLIALQEADDREKSEVEKQTEEVLHQMMGGTPEEVGFEETRDFFLSLQRHGSIPYTREETIVSAHAEFKHNVERVARDLEYVDGEDGDLEAAIDRVDEHARVIARQIRVDRKTVDNTFRAE